MIAFKGKSQRRVAILAGVCTVVGLAVRLAAVGQQVKNQPRKRMASNKSSNRKLKSVFAPPARILPARSV